MSQNAQEEFMFAVAEGSIDKMKEAISKGADPKHKNSIALENVSEYNEIECVKFLIPLSDPQAINSRALRTAAAYGHIECLDLLIPVSSPKDYAWAMQNAVEAGHIECVKRLLAADSSIETTNNALLTAAINLRSECLKLLLPYADADAVRILLTNEDYEYAEQMAMFDGLHQEYILSGKHLGSPKKKTHAKTL